MDGANKREPVFLLDVDNTLLDNDRAKEDIKAALHALLGEQETQRFWSLYEEVRGERGVVDYPETLRRFAAESRDLNAARMAADLINNWPYREYVYPGSLPAIRYLQTIGEAAILSDGDDVYQPHKIESAGLEEAVGGRDHVLIYTHKETCFGDVMRRLPARHYVLVDDKERILAGAKEPMGEWLTTIWVRQGHYAADPAQYEKPDPDLVIDSIADLCDLSKGQLLERTP